MEKNKMNKALIITSKSAKFQKFASSVTMILVAITMFIIGIFAIRKTVFFNLVINYANEKCFFKPDNILLNLLLCFLTLVCLYVIYKKILPKISEKTFVISAIIFSQLLGLWWVNYIKFQPLSDQSMVVYCANALLDDTFSTILEPGEYLNRNPHQLGFVVYIMTAFKLLNTRDPLTLQILNTIYSTINLLLLYLICKEIFKEDLIRKIALLLITFFSFYWAFFNVHVYGNIPGLMFALFSLLFTIKYIEQKKLYQLALIAISITIAYMLKSNYQIFLCAIVVILALNAIQTKKIAPVIGIAGILIFMFSFKTFIYTYIEKSTGYSLDTGVCMTAYVYMGIAEPTTLSPGWYTADVERIYTQSNFNTEASKPIAKELLVARTGYLLNNLDYTFRYFYSKLQTTWLNPTFQVFWCSTPSTMLNISPEYNGYISSKQLLISMLTGEAYKFEERAMDVYQIITFIFASVGLFASYKEGNLKKTVLPITFLGGFAFHVIWETKSIYVIQYFYIMLPFAAVGLYKTFRKLDEFLQNNTNSQENKAQILEFKKKTE